MNPKQRPRRIVPLHIPLSPLFVFDSTRNTYNDATRSLVNHTKQSVRDLEDRLQETNWDKDNKTYTAAVSTFLDKMTATYKETIDREDIVDESNVLHHMSNCHDWAESLLQVSPPREEGKEDKPVG